MNANEQKKLKNAFKFYKNEGSYRNIRKVMQGESPNRPIAHTHARVMKNWFSGAHVRRGNLTGKLYRGIPFHPQGNKLANRSFTSWTPRLNKALRFVAGSRNRRPGVILVMNAQKVPAYVRYNKNAPTFWNRVGGNTEEEVLLPPGQMKLGNRKEGVYQLKFFGSTRNIPYSSVNVLDYKS